MTDDAAKRKAGEGQTKNHPYGEQQFDTLLAHTRSGLVTDQEHCVFSMDCDTCPIGDAGSNDCGDRRSVIARMANTAAKFRRQRDEALEDLRFQGIEIDDLRKRCHEHECRASKTTVVPVYKPAPKKFLGLFPIGG